MKKRIAIVGGGIVGSTAAYYLSQMPNADERDVVMFDDSYGQATKAASGIISPWLSKRRNKQWYNLAKAGAKLIPEIANATHMNSEIFDHCGTIITRENESNLDELYLFAKERAQVTPEMGKIQKLDRKAVQSQIPILTNPKSGVLVSGGSRINGALFCQHLISIAKKNNLTVHDGRARLINDHTISFKEQSFEFDRIIVATGAWVKETMQPLNVKVHVRPQKGQLVELKVPDFPNHENMPVMMPEGEYDFIPLGHEKLIVGATHDDDKGFDLSKEASVDNQLIDSAQNLVSGLNSTDIILSKVGTRAYTNDFAPFFGIVPNHDNVLIGSGLGSSGLTTGPMIGKLLAGSAIFGGHPDWKMYEKPISNYIS